MANSKTRPGSSQDDPVIALLNEHGIPVTRETYLDVAHMGQPPKWHPELEADLPEHLQDWTLKKWRHTDGHAHSTAQSEQHTVRRAGLGDYPALTAAEQKAVEMS